ncbi:MAG TPA: MFS transporter [Candidatus Acidoferrales bacterium]|nr:MFS transporter [Candidatus Acidoferrales bacterium]
MNLSKQLGGRRPGIGANLPQFILLIGVNGLVGALVGQERSLGSLLGSEVFGVRSAVATLAFVAAFGAAKAVANLAAGAASDRWGRKPVLVTGWLLAVPVPALLIVAPSWDWVVAANLLLGVSQGLSWSATVIMKIDLAGPRQRGLAAGLNEFAGYLAVALSAAASGLLASRYGLRPQPFFLGLAVAGLGLGLSALLVRETSPGPNLGARRDTPAFRTVFALGSFGDRSLSALSRTGLVNNANDALAWGLLPLLFAARGLDLRSIGVLAGLYPGVWGVAQLLTGPLSDRLGRRPVIALGMWVQALALVWFLLGSGFAGSAAAAVLLGLGTALVYPALIAAVGDFSEPGWRAAATGVYRFWRDAGYAIGAVAAGVAADLGGAGAAIGMVAVVTALSGLDAWLNLARPQPGPLPAFKR